MDSRYTALEKGKQQMREENTKQILRIKAPSLDTSALIKDNELTIIGRLTNPSEQKMWALIPSLPRKWNLRGRAVGSDLGNNCFQFRFEKEDDLRRVLDNRPYLFARWMVIIQSWEPVISTSFPSLIPFWIRIKGIPLHYWHDEMVSRIGQDLGTLENHELTKTTARVRVHIDGLKPLVKESLLEFDSGEESLISLEYEKLDMHCSTCYSLLHHRRFCPQRVNDVIIAKEHHGRDSKVEEPGNYYQEGTNGQVTGRNIRSNAIIVADATKSEKNQGRAPIMQAINTHETQSFKERVDRHGVPFGERISTKQTRNPPPAANPNQKANMSWREKPPRNDGGNYTSPPYAKSRSGIVKQFHKSGDLFPPRNEGWWGPKNVDEVEVTSKETPTSQEKDGGRRSPIPSENLNETANTLQIPTLEAIMEELNESTRLYVSHADPIEAAARRQRVLTGDALGETEERARAMLEAAREKLLCFKQTGDLNSNPVTPPPANEILQMDQRGQALMVASTPSETPEEDQRAIPHDEAKTTNEDQIEKEPSKLKSIIVSPNANREEKNLNDKATIEGIEEEETLLNYQNRSRRRTVRRSASKNLRSTPNIIRGASSKKESYPKSKTLQNLGNIPWWEIPLRNIKSERGQGKHRRDSHISNPTNPSHTSIE